MGARPAGFVCGGVGRVVVARTERPALPAVGHSRRTFRARHLVCCVRFRTQTRGSGVKADFAGLPGPGGNHTLRRATGSARPTDHALAAQLQGTDRFAGRRGARDLARWDAENRKPADHGNSRRSVYASGGSQTRRVPGRAAAYGRICEPGAIYRETNLVGSGRSPP